MSILAEKAYEAYKRTAKMNFVQVTTAKLNVIYNIECRMKRDPEYKAELDAFSTEEGDSIATLIEKYFTGYNARHGLEIRETLTEFLDPDFAEGAYFTIDTYKKTDGILIPTAPTEFAVGDTAHAVIKLYSHVSGEPIKTERIKYMISTDDGVSNEGYVSDTDTLELDLMLSRPGLAYFRVNAVDADNKNVLGFETAFGGVLFDFKKIQTTHKSPADLYEFWDRAIDRMLKVNPTDTTPDGYRGLVEYEYDMPSSNRFILNKADEEFVERLCNNGIGGITKEHLSEYDVYELNLKAPGPCHSSNFLTIPKNAESKSLPIMIATDGYSAYPLSPHFNKSHISLHCSHHGYDITQPLEGYYMKLRRGVCANYGCGNDRQNAKYEDINDNYMLYLHLRNMQAIRFMTDPALSRIIPTLHDKWNGEIMLDGGSMGGYQSICLAGLIPILQKKSAPFTLTGLTANIPAFCNLAGITDSRVRGFTSYTEGMDYFDAAHLAAYVNAPIKIPRVGLGDTTCPPNGIMAMFNNLPEHIHKEISFLQNSDHGTLPEPQFQKWFRYTFN